MKFYTGIGSRKTPDFVLNEMFNVANNLANNGYVLRSGKAQGADTAFQLGCQKAKGRSEIFIPWNGFGKDVNYNPKALDLDHSRDILAKFTPEAEEIAMSLHPVWNKLSQGAKKLHTRNVFQVLGADLKTPSKFVLYYAPVVNGVVQGGTATAVKLAKRNGIPTINMLDVNWYLKLSNVYRESL